MKKIEKEGFLDGDERVSFLMYIIDWGLQCYYNQRSVEKGIIF